MLRPTFPSASTTRNCLCAMRRPWECRCEALPLTGPHPRTSGRRRTSVLQTAEFCRLRAERQILEGRRLMMRVFVAGGTGVVGRRLVPQLVARGNQVTGTTTSRGKLNPLAQLGAEGMVMDGLNATSVRDTVSAARPEAVVHLMTAISRSHAGKPDMKHM